MEMRQGKLTALSHLLHKHLLLLMLGSYVTAAFFPTLGLAIRDASIEHVGLIAMTTKVNLSMLMLACLLFNAGLGVKIGQIREMVRSPVILAVGMAANQVIPVAFIFVVSQVMSRWHNADEVQCILVGLALVASMPIAGSSTAWAQNADGQVALSLGLVLFSTLISPVTTPVALHAAGLMASGDYAEDLHELASGGTGTFLAVGVLLPSMLGIAVRRLAGDARIDAMKPGIKLVNFAVLLALNYSNASASLPQVVANPDADFLAATLAIVAGLCVLAFAAGWWIARILGATSSQRTSLMFGLGMNNNGTGLVLASMALADHPRVMLPIIFYNLVQHLVAGVVDRFVAGRFHRRDPHGVVERADRPERIVHVCASSCGIGTVARLDKPEFIFALRSA